MAHLWSSSCLFSHHLFHSTANAMTYYVFQLDSPWCLLSNSLAACELQSRLSIFHHDSGELAPNVWRSVKSKQEETWREKRRVWILILIFWLFTFVNNIYHETEYVVFLNYLQGGFWLLCSRYFICAKSFHALFCTSSVKKKGEDVKAEKLSVTNCYLCK